MWLRAASGDASSAEGLFYLATRSPDRRQDLKQINHEVHHGGGVLVVPGVTVDESEWSEAARSQQKQLVEETGVGDSSDVIGARVREARKAE